MLIRFIDNRIAVVLVVCSVSFGAAGCHSAQVRAAAPLAAAPSPAVEERPMNVAPDTDATPPPETVAAPPTLPPAPTPTPEPVTVAPPKPVPPRSPREASTETEAEQPAHPPAPQISPQLSPSDQATYERKTVEDSAAAEKNLLQTSGKQLNAAQQDLVGKIRSSSRKRATQARMATGRARRISRKRLACYRKS